MKLTRLLPQTGLPADQLQVPWSHLMQAHVALLQPSVEVLIMAPMIICLVATDVYLVCTVVWYRPAGKVAKLFTLPIWLLRNVWVQGSSHYELWLVLALTHCCPLLALLTGSQANRSWPGTTRSLLLRRQSSHRQLKSNNNLRQGFAVECCSVLACGDSLRGQV